MRRISLRGMPAEKAILKLLKHAKRPLFPYAIQEGLIIYGFRCSSINFRGYVGNYIRKLTNAGLIEQAPSGHPSWEFPQGLRLTQKGKRQQ